MAVAISLLTKGRSDNATGGLDLEDMDSEGPQVDLPDSIPQDPLQSQILHDILRTTFNLTNFRSCQQAVITTALTGKDVVVVMPTGSGKSICYQIPAIIGHRQHGKLTMVITPLLALIDDQVTELKKKGIDAMGWTSNNEELVVSRLEEGNLPVMIYLSPERLEMNARCLELLSKQSQRLHMFVLDEAHCIITENNWRTVVCLDLLTRHTNTDNLLVWGT